jgi:integrase
MPALTDISVQNYRPQAKRREIPDGKAGLYLVIQPKPSGKKSWAVRLRRPDGTTAKITLGGVDLPDIEPEDNPVRGAVLTLRQARELAAQYDRKRARGVDVIHDIKVEKLRQQDATADRTAVANSFGVLARQFFTDYVTEKWQARPRRWRENASVLGLKYPLGSDPIAGVEPEVIKGSLADKWDKKPVAEIDKFEVESVLDEAHRRSRSRARKIYSVLNIFFKWLPLKFANPMIELKKKPRPPKSRDRNLDETEIKIFWRATDHVGGVYGALFKILLLTGCRVKEVSGMTRAELGDKGVWEIPSDRTKNHLAFLVPLPQTALDIINAVEPVKSRDTGSNSGLVFACTTGQTPISGFSKMKKLLDAEMAKIAGHAIPHWRLHDLRRSFSTILNESSNDEDSEDESEATGLGVPPHVVEALLNHVSGEAKKGVAGTYNKAKYLREKRMALQRWATHLQGLLSDKPSNIAKLPRRKQGQ